MKKLLVAGFAAAALYGAPAFAADMPTKATVKAESESLLDFTVAFGGTWNSGPSVRSSSGFYTGDIDSFGGITASVSATVPVGKVGNYNVRFGPKIEWMQGSFHFKGLAGGVQETLSGHQDQWNYLAILLFSTKLASGQEFYFGPVAGYADVSTHGTPCFGCPQYRDPGSLVVGAHASIWAPVNKNLDVGVGVDYRLTGSTSNPSTTTEIFRNGINQSVMATVLFTFDASDVVNAAQKSGYASKWSPNWGPYWGR
jgi:hypothetical protein